MVQSSKIVKKFLFTNRTVSKKSAEALGFKLHKDALNNNEAGKYISVTSVYELSSEKSKCYGVFAEQDLEKGTELEFYCGKELSAQEASKITNRDYIFEVGSGDSIDAQKIGSWHRFINHSDSPNIGFAVLKDKIRFFVKRKIFAGEQAFIDYGPYYPFQGCFYLSPWNCSLSLEERFLNIKNEEKSLYQFHEIDNTTAFYLPSYLLTTDNITSNPNLPIYEVNKEPLELKSKQSNMSSLSYAIKYNQHENIKSLLNSGADLGIQDCNGQTAIHYIILHNNGTNEDKKQILNLCFKKRSFKENNSILNIKDKDGKTAAQYVIEIDDFEDSGIFAIFFDLFKKYIQNSFDIHIANKNDITLFLVAIREGRIGALQLLLNYHCKPLPDNIKEQENIEHITKIKESLLELGEKDIEKFIELEYLFNNTKGLSEKNKDFLLTIINEINEKNENIKKHKLHKKEQEKI